MNPIITKNDWGGVILKCPKCNTSLGINPLVIKTCTNCGVSIEHTKKYVDDWILYCRNVVGDLSERF